MSDTPEIKIQMAKIEQKLDDHVSTQSIDMAELKTVTARIEAKLDIKANKDEVEKVIGLATFKADKVEIADVKDDIRQIRNNLWGLLVGVILALLSAVITLIKIGVIK